MPVAVTYPGVYLSEIPSGSSTITPVSTGVAAFVGRAPIGRVDVPTTIFSYGDFIRAYGGLQYDYPLSYSVQDFFANGGSQAVIARLFEPLPGQGDGVARLPFPPAPEVVPTGWQLGAPAVAGATSLTISPPTIASDGAPDVGMTVQVGNDPTQYLVAGYTEANPAKKTAATITIVPGLVAAYPQCAAMTFADGDDPTSWTVTTTSGSTVTLANGSGLPDIGDVLTFGPNATTSYTVISEPTVSGTDPSALTVKVTVTPNPAAYSGPATFTDATAMPMPQGWQITGFTAGSTGPVGTISVINGTNPPLVGDTFTVGSSNDTYAVTAFAPATAKAPASVTFQSVSGDTLVPTTFCSCCAPVFSRAAPVSMAIKTGAKAGGNSFMPARVPATTGTVDIGDTFQVGTDPTVYSVRYVDPIAGTVYFLPEAQQDFAGALVFAPPLTLRAISPGQWGNYLVASTDQNGITASTAKQFASYGLGPTDLFNLTLTLKDATGRTITVERYVNQSVSMSPQAVNFPNRIDRTLSANSNLALVDVMPMGPPQAGASTIGTGGNDGTYLQTSTYLGDQDQRTGMYLLEEVPIFNLMCIPPDQRITDSVDVDLDPAVNLRAAEYCTDRRAFFIADPPAAWTAAANTGQIASIDPDSMGITGQNADGIEIARNAAVFFPRLRKEDILMKSQPATFSPCGTIAGVFAATDVARGVWKSPAGIGAGLAGVSALEFNLSDPQNGLLNPLGINCLRTFPVIGSVVWGSRTLRGADLFEDDYKYISVRRLTLFIEQSLYQGTQWAVFEPNNEALWSSLRLSATTFLAGLARQGAFYSYAVTCDATTTTAADIEAGQVNMLVQIAPVRPAEFVVLQIQQTAATVSAS